MWPLTWGDPLGRVAGIDYGESVVKFGYSYVADENNIYRKTFDHRAGTPYNEYTYDDLDRLTDVTYHDSDTEAFVMDALGNRTGNQTLREDGTVNFTVDSLTNRYASVGGNSITHDDAGNLATDRQGYVYFYDYENRVVKIEDSSSNDVAEYAYDALGRRIRMIDSVASTTTLYYYNPEWQCLAEYAGAGTHQRYFVYGNYIDEPLVLNDGTNDYYYAHDHLYSTVALTNSIGQTVERYEYDAYGTVHIMDASYNPRTARAYGNPYTFTGRQLDTLDNGSLQRMHYRHRDYSPGLGRFVTHDPIGVVPSESIFNKISHFRQYVDGLNLYQYVRSDPVGNSDAYGQALWYCWNDTAFGIPIIHHGYIYDDRPRQWGGSGGQSCGTSGSSGSQIMPGDRNRRGGSDDGNRRAENHLGFPDGWQPGPPEDYPYDIWEQDGHHCTRIQNSDDNDDALDCVMIHCYEHANDGLWLPIVNDCHNTVEDALDECGLPMVDDSGCPIPPVRMF